jgi:uncharacterized protein (DUF1800 family)
MFPEENIETPVSLSMSPYAGPWTKSEAAHLLKRTMFGPTNQQMLDAAAAGMNSTVTALLQIPTIDQPLTNDPAETISAYGTTWVTSVYPANVSEAILVENARIKSLGAWMLKKINTEQFSIAEKMCLFWHNHFGVTASSDSRATYNYLMLLRQHALGNVRQLIKDITIDPCMLQFLNGASNTLYSPNENYARELLELFTVGKGIQIGEGDYSNYTEEDVAAGAKILTGYLVLGMRSDTITTPYSNFAPILHDTSTKQLSYHFDGVTIGNAGPNEYSNYIDIIFQEPSVANFISTELYRYFVNYDLTQDVLDNVIPVMAQTMIDNNYEILPVVEELLKSEHFYDVSLKGSIIRGPLELMFGILNATTSVPNYDLAINSDMYLAMYWLSESMGQAYAAPPSVAGWPAYYQAPAFSKLWINSTTIKTRFDIATAVTVFTGLPVGGENFKVNALGFLNALSIPNNATAVIDDICDVFCPKSIGAGQKLILKNLLTNSLGDAEWELQYDAYNSDPGNPSLADPIAFRVNLVLNQVFKMPQFQTI